MAATATTSSLSITNMAPADAQGECRRRPLHRPRIRARGDDGQLRRHHRSELRDRLAGIQPNRIAIAAADRQPGPVRPERLCHDRRRRRVRQDRHARTEFGDHVVSTETGVFGAGLTVSYATIEALEVDTLEGDDTIDVIGTAAGISTRVIGGLGSDIVDVTGDVFPDVVTKRTDLPEGGASPERADRPARRRGRRERREPQPLAAAARSRARRNDPPSISPRSTTSRSRSTS